MAETIVMPIPRKDRFFIWRKMKNKKAKGVKKTK